VTGVIRSIEAVSWLVHPFADDTPEMDERSQYVAPESAAIETKLSAQRGDQVGGRSCMGYLVELDVDSA
jgi:hypothetical protein